MSVSWTKEQQNVIDYRNRNILVSAAAGSGKTAVLVERIIKRITEDQPPVDIDRLLVVTFTKAAAAEMRERISAAIDQLREAHPTDINLEKQLTLIHNAQITTIDSFCLFVVRNHFQEINLEPNFRIADSGEVKLLEMDVLDEVFEQNYEKTENLAFLELIDAYSNKKSDQNVKNMVEKIYRLSGSNPWPKEWIKELVMPYSVESEEKLLQMPMMKEITDYVISILRDAKNQLMVLKEIASLADGPQKYVATIEDDLLQLEDLDQLADYESINTFLNRFSMKNLSAVRNFTGDEAKKERVQKERGKIKKEIEALKKKYFSKSLTEQMEQLQRMQPIIAELVRLTLEYMEVLEKRKRERRIADFSDIEHFALNILVDEHTKEPRKAAQELKEQFEEIMIDEYQDSNQVQEEIMCAISRMDRGENNMFMVGDVKQSIYRFRLARPELFMSKYSTYNTCEGKEQRIDLHQNFRSRQQVVDIVNDIFEKIMQKDLGNVAYDEEAKLYCGASYDLADGNDAEILLFDMDEELLPEMEDLNQKQMEAHMVADKINQMMQAYQVTDKKSRKLRNLEYRDIVILFRSLKEWGTDFAQILESYGIPAHVESQTGYFSAVEVQTVLSMLKILDNPYQDIPMTAVLKSPMVGLDNEELAQIRAENPELSYAAAVVKCARESTEGKLKVFWDDYLAFRAMIQDTPIHELIIKILDVTGYGNYVTALPAGEKRAANLQMLIEKAIAYEATSYKGLFHFVRYIDQLQKYDIDFGEAETIGEGENVVHIMTIHKSKGLEFPVVFVSGINKQFNRMDANEAMVVHPDLGIGLNEMQVNPRTKRSCFVKDEISARIIRENLGEELRVLYVALTRAKEKLILTGCIKDAAKTISGYQGVAIEGKALPFHDRVAAKSYMDWVIPAVISYPEKYQIQIIESKDIVIKQIERFAENQLNYQQMLSQIQNADNKRMTEVTRCFLYQYPYQNEMNRKSKYSVSELKHDSMVMKYDQIEGMAEKPKFLEEDKETYIPAFMQDGESKENITKDENLGAQRGTAVHRIMECMQFAKLTDIDVTHKKERQSFLQEQLDQMVEKEQITKEMLSIVPLSVIESFLQSNTAKRMALADQEGNLFREKPFVMDYEGVLVQGIIDAFWMEGDQIVLLDYKTDYVKTGEELILRYKKQMELYTQALSKVFHFINTSQPVRECLIYSFCLQEVIVI